ncbi:hypothetical protein [Blastococcus sp. TBT05-19]|uniref:hypothetical protein n=1 Tax=Blastococcus sp. TBT05-19 TaxID=2250581 RepID=UPI0013149E7D|nr:hypothetical protein [Blastococcus sp. TBT05-19]
MVRTRSPALRPLLAVVPVGLLLAGALVWQSTAAAFTATTDNAGNTWRAGSVALTDSAGGSALFDPATDGALQPGSTGSRCIRVDYTGDLPADIRLYVTTPTAGAVTLDPFLVMSVEQGQDVTAATTVDADCTGFTSTATPTFRFNTASADLGSADQTKTLAALKAASPDYARGLPVGSSVPGGTSLTFRITYSVVDDNNAQNARSSTTFTWEAQNTP